MFQLKPIYARIIDGAQYPDGQVTVEFFGHPGESPHKEVHVAPGIYACLHDSMGNFRGVRRLVPESDEERSLFEEKKLIEISKIYGRELQFRA